MLQKTPTYMITTTEKSIIEALSLVKNLISDLLYREAEIIPSALTDSSLPPDEQQKILSSLQFSQVELG